jgi:hypothetical protein
MLRKAHLTGEEVAKGDRMKARIRGRRVPEEQPQAVLSPPRPARSGRGANPVAVIGAAGAAGLFLAKLLDGRSRAHPRD